MARTTTIGRNRTTTATASTSTERRRWTAPIVGGLIAGAIAGMAMAAWTMIAGSTYANTGFFTPMYLIASPFAGTSHAARSLAAANTGDMFFWATGAALLGAAIHMADSMMFGLVFGVLARLARIGRYTAIVAGMIFGLVLMAFMDWIAQPVTDAIFGGGHYVTGIGSILGWGTWTVAHLIFGGMLGLWVALRPRDVAATDDIVTLP